MRQSVLRLLTAATRRSSQRVPVDRDSRVITDGPRLSAWGKSSGTVKFKGVTYKAIERGGRGHSYADDRAEGKFCGFYCVTAWITKSINAQGRLTSSNSGLN